MTFQLDEQEFPELIFGLLAPIGVDLEMVSSTLEKELSIMGYDSELLKLTDLMKQIPSSVKIDEDSHIDTFKGKIAYANDLRNRFGDEVMSVLATTAIRSLRKEINSKNPEIPEQEYAEQPIPKQAYVIRQLKRPEEVELLRSVYGRQFILISAYAPRHIRLLNIEEKQRDSVGGLATKEEIHEASYEIINKDEKETDNSHGQNVNDAFPLGDVFIDATTKKSCNQTLQRFVKALFGNNQITPSQDEYGMYMAKSASLRSSDLSRQVGAAIFNQSAEILTLGCNEVPKAGGGTYWENDPNDSRDFTLGQDPNDRIKKEIFIDTIDRLIKNEYLSDELLKKENARDILHHMLQDKDHHSMSKSKVMDIIEFGRIIHAEMCAITDAARNGISVKDAIMYVTTFPCHLCAKHIVGAGIKEVVFIEPYPKSYANELHSDSIELDQITSHSKVVFRPFTGIAPFRYRDLFEKRKRKKDGKSQEWLDGKIRPMIKVYVPSYHKAETLLVSLLYERIKPEPKSASKKKTIRRKTKTAKKSAL